MPRPQKPGAKAKFTRTRTGCWSCKEKKIKCGEQKPECSKCTEDDDLCDYSLRLNWDGKRTPGQPRVRKKLEEDGRKKVATARTSSPSFNLPTAALNVQRTAMEGVMNVENDRTGTHALQGAAEQETYELERVPSSNTANLGNYGRGGEPSSSSFSPTDTALSFNDLESPPRFATDINTFRYDSQATPMPSSPAFYSETGVSTPSSAFSIARSAALSPSIISASTGYGTPTTPQRPYSQLNYNRARLGLPPRIAKYGQSSPPLPTVQVQTVPNHRRISVQSLVSDPQDMPNLAPYNQIAESAGNYGNQNWPLQSVHDGLEVYTYGIDRGLRDSDIPINDDKNAISMVSPEAGHATIVDLNAEGAPFEFGFGIFDNNAAGSGGGYYEKPVPVCIARALILPPILLENQMNLLYFHHFINHTAGCLIPHNCASNPFKKILPEMAVQDPNLMNLLLAYSASHRARLLRQPEPATRIALWVQNIFPNLRRAIEDPNERITNANIATAIMLASLEIIAPSAFGVSVPWQTHLDMARQMIAARGGPQSMRTESRSNEVSSFLWSWFAYLDVLGSLSGGKASASHSAWILDYDVEDEMDYQIDCILGFTSKCIRVLANIAELSRVCDIQRLAAESRGDEWKPTEAISIKAKRLEEALADSRQHPARPCTHMTSTGEAAYHWDNLEMAATNEAFHWAGAVHLHRRILGKPSGHADVQAAVKEIFGALYKVRKGSSAEACLLFPMFTAGCEAEYEVLRDDILKRLKGVERFGMTQVRNARQLMEKVWETGKPWETLVAGEFFG